jgi:hypothetical protein
MHVYSNVSVALRHSNGARGGPLMLFVAATFAPRIEAELADFEYLFGL